MAGVSARKNRLGLPTEKELKQAAPHKFHLREFKQH